MMASGSNANFDFAVGSTQRGINRLSCGNLMNLIFLMPGIETEVFWVAQKLLGMGYSMK